MNIYCEEYLAKDHDKINLSKDIACCLGLLIEKYDESELSSLQKSYAGFLVRTINHYLKQINYNISNDNLLFKENETVNIILFGKLINIISHYSIILMNHNKNDYVKLIASIGIDLINFSKYKYNKSFIRKKSFLLNSLSCIYLSEQRFYKSQLFLKKCIQENKTSLDYIITYNNLCLVSIKKMKLKKNANTKEEINNILYYLRLQLKELIKRITNKYNSENEKEGQFHKKETTGFLMYNCFYMMKFFDEIEFDKNYENGLKIVKGLLGKNHFIYIKMIRIKNNWDDENSQKLIDEITNEDNNNDFSFRNSNN